MRRFVKRRRTGLEKSFAGDRAWAAVGGLAFVAGSKRPPGSKYSILRARDSVSGGSAGDVAEGCSSTTALNGPIPCNSPFTSAPLKKSAAREDGRDLLASARDGAAHSSLESGGSVPARGSVSNRASRELRAIAMQGSPPLADAHLVVVVPRRGQHPSVVGDAAVLGAGVLAQAIPHPDGVPGACGEQADLGP